MTRAKDISKIVTDADLSGTLDVTGAVTAGGLTVDGDGLAYSASNIEMRGDANVRVTLGTAGVAGANNSSNWVYGNGTNLRFNNAGGYYSWETLGTEQMRITSGGDLLVNTTTDTSGGFSIQTISSNTTATRMLAHGFSCRDNWGTATNLGNGIFSPAGNTLAFSTGSTERMRIDSSGNLLVGRTNNTGFSANSVVLSSVSGNGSIFDGTGNTVAFFNRRTSDGEIINFSKDGTTVGSIGSAGGAYMYIGSTSVQETYIGFNNNYVYPSDNDGAFKDNAIDLGNASARYDDIYATNGTINTSDQNEKNTITDSDLGIDFIKRLTPKSYIFNGKTRTHYGLIAQDVETVLTDINKRTSEFAGFIKTDISEEQDGSEYRYGLRYTEFVAPLIQAVKDQQATIDALTARITALENGV